MPTPAPLQHAANNLAVLIWFEVNYHQGWEAVALEEGVPWDVFKSEIGFGTLEHRAEALDLMWRALRGDHNLPLVDAQQPPYSNQEFH